VAEPTGSKQKGPGKRYIEIVNWRKAQPRMAEGQNFWCKLYTDLLDNDSYHEFSNESRVLVTAIWMYAARTGKHVFPSDPKWLHKRIPMLYEEPDFEPLLNARNIYGEPTPFIRYCDARRPRMARGGNSRGGRTRRKGGASVGLGANPGPKQAIPAGHPKNGRRGKNKKHTVEKRREPKPFILRIRVSEREKREKSLRISQEKDRAPHSTAAQNRSRPQHSRAAQNPRNPQTRWNPKRGGHQAVLCLCLPPRLAASGSIVLSKSLLSTYQPIGSMRMPRSLAGRSSGPLA